MCAALHRPLVEGASGARGRDEGGAYAWYSINAVLSEPDAHADPARCCSKRAFAATLCAARRATQPLEGLEDWPLIILLDEPRGGSESHAR